MSSLLKSKFLKLPLMYIHLYSFIISINSNNVQLTVQHTNTELPNQSQGPGTVCTLLVLEPVIGDRNDKPNCLRCKWSTDSISYENT